MVGVERQRLGGCLDVEAELGLRQEEPESPLVLLVPARSAERQPWRPVPEHHRPALVVTSIATSDAKHLHADEKKVRSGTGTPPPGGVDAGHR
jgi:hypothetical protein